MNYKEQVKQLKARVEITEDKMEVQEEKHKQELEQLNAMKNSLLLDIKLAEEKTKENWIMNPKYLILSVEGFTSPYECEFKKYNESNWRKGFIVGTSFDTAKKYKVCTSISGNKYEWAICVRLDPEQFDCTLRENNRRMSLEYNIDTEEA